MSTPIKVGSIGAGLAGQAHAFGYRNAMVSVSSPISVELSTIADPNLPLAQSVAARYGFVVRNTRYAALEFDIYGYKPYE